MPLAPRRTPAKAPCASDAFRQLSIGHFGSNGLSSGDACDCQHIDRQGAGTISAPPTTLTTTCRKNRPGACYLRHELLHFLPPIPSVESASYWLRRTCDRSVRCTAAFFASSKWATSLPACIIKTSGSDQFSRQHLFLDSPATRLVFIALAVGLFATDYVWPPKKGFQGLFGSYRREKYTENEGRDTDAGLDVMLATAHLPTNSLVKADSTKAPSGSIRPISLTVGFGHAVGFVLQRRDGRLDVFVLPLADLWQCRLLHLRQPPRRNPGSGTTNLTALHHGSR